jgi:hypothetical protein
MFFCLLLFEGTFTSFFKDKKIRTYRSHKRVGIEVFLLFLLDDRRIRMRSRTSDLQILIRIQEAKKQTVRIRIRNTVCQTGLWNIIA